ncbi:hypothetical protein [Kingella sp. (in: b-proteobacteria)]|nr:hypothetical protein [Kingella sp. (in: b-proteobacteria)]MDO4658693.1 hypothetical protein [Kingella sp. (in: b-proteobacteria)]
MEIVNTGSNKRVGTPCSTLASKQRQPENKKSVFRLPLLGKQNNRR